jgi:hypothetical protein
LKKNILKYSSLLALLGSTFFSTQTFAAECATGTVPATGCRVDVSNITYTLTGDITSGAAQGAGILFDSDSAIINYTGAISVEAMGVGFDIGADNNTMNMTGNINIAAGSDTRRGVIFNQGENNTFNLTGNILTANEDGYGVIYSAGSANIGAVEGNITTSGLEAHGIAFDNSRLNNHTQTGNITTAGLDAYGIYLLTGSESNTINMTGDISTTSDGSSGVFLESVGGLITNSNTINITGNITTAGDGSHGIYSLDSDSNTYTVIGDINTTGNNGRGLFIRRSDSNTVNMTGNIITTGDSEGIRLNGSESNNITINGNIITSGTDGDSEPISINNSDSNTFTLSGAVHSLGGDQAIAVNTTSQNNTFTFKRGASFIGGLENNGGTTNKLIFDMGKASSYNLELMTHLDIEDTSKPIVSGSAKSMGVADIDNQAHILYRRMDPVNDVLSERQRLYKEGQRPTGYYIDSYYGHDKRNEDYSEISGNAGGMTVGYVLENTNTPMEVLVNFEVSQDNYGSGLAKQTTETNSVMAGLFLPALVEDVMGGNISAKVLVSGSDNDAKRTVLNNSLGLTKASEKVSGDYNSGFISAGAEWLTEFLKVERVRHDISIGADLVQAYNEDYTAGEYKVDSRDMTQIQSRILYGMTYKNAKKTVDVNTRFGVSNQYMVSGDKQDYKINGTSVSYTGDDNSFYYTAGLGAKYYLADNTNLYVDTKYGQSSDDIQNMTIDFGFISRF